MKGKKSYLVQVSPRAHDDRVTIIASLDLADLFHALHEQKNKRRRRRRIIGVAVVVVTLGYSLL